ncbi:MAG: hypothetical protein MUW56_15045 [Chryseobacterium sp.]|uniref:hypothetical protein n=1 Tax=Chryseobacterium sp. TaxID=1871047 RepID=UPI0025BC27F4|nr:hypothetical protein [Chryseobacterium sp.]MCJ7934893.1 hypothetical protein [Chryseobacterium sp.]
MQKKKVKLVSNLENKSLLKETIKSSERMDLYKSVFGGQTGPGTGLEPGDCDIAIADTGASAAYNRTGTFLRV